MKPLLKYLTASALLTSIPVLTPWVLDKAFPLDLSRLNSQSQVIAGEDGRPLRIFSTRDGLLRLGSTSASVDARFLTFLKSYEDKRFDQHWGIDPLALVRATGQWISAGKVVSGGSTLTMQTARLLEPRPRTLTSKLIEMGRALQLEWHYSKVEILDIYLTLAPYGGRLEGLRSASLSYLGKEPNHLSIAEAALLTVLPQAPSSLRPDRFPDAAETARNKVLKRLHEAGIISQAEMERAQQSSVPTLQAPLPLLAPHLAERLGYQTSGNNEIRTSLWPWLQRQVQNIAQDRLRAFGPDVSIAALVVENKTRQVRAHLGSADYLDHRRAGYIDMTHAIRSPGSTLKPLIYGLSFDAGQSHPQTLIWDRELSNAAYRPANFSGKETGQITLAKALRQSLNIPVVKVLDHYGPIRFSETLKRHGLNLRLPSDRTLPSLAIALGGNGLTLEELVKLYSALADNRRLCPLTTQVQPSPCPVEAEITTPRTQSWLTGILQTTPRPQGFSHQGQSGAAPIAFKTGTSYGYRDAWAIGYSDRFTVGVWVGKADGTPNPGQTGLHAAAPILFSLFDRLPASSSHGQQLNADWKAPAPTGLRHFPERFLPLLQEPVPSAFQIASPQQDSRYLLSDLQSRGLNIQAKAGKRPLVWLINGVPQPSNPWKRAFRWTPETPGFYSISAIDSSGKTTGKIQISITRK